MPRRSLSLEFRQASTWLPLIGCLAVTFPRFLLDSGDSIQRMSLPWATALSVWWCLPLLGIVLGSQSVLVRWAGSLVYIGVASWILAGVYGSDSSTAVFGIMFPPLYLAFAMGVVLGVEALWWRTQDR